MNLYSNQLQHRESQQALLAKIPRVVASSSNKAEKLISVVVMLAFLFGWVYTCIQI